MGYLMSQSFMTGYVVIAAIAYAALAVYVLKSRNLGSFATLLLATYAVAQLVTVATTGQTVGILVSNAIFGPIK